MSVASWIWFSCRSISSPGGLLCVHKAFLFFYSSCRHVVPHTLTHTHIPFFYLCVTPSQSGSLDLPSPLQISCHNYHTPLNVHEQLRWPRSEGPSCLLCSLICRSSSSLCVCLRSQYTHTYRRTGSSCLWRSVCVLFFTTISTLSLEWTQWGLKKLEWLQQWGKPFSSEGLIWLFALREGVTARDVCQTVLRVDWSWRTQQLIVEVSSVIFTSLASA